MIICGNCGAQNANKNKYCSACGHPLILSQEDIIAAHTQPKRKRYLLPILAAVLGLIGLGIWGFFATRSSNEDNRSDDMPIANVDSNSFPIDTVDYVPQAGSTVTLNSFPVARPRQEEVVVDTTPAVAEPNYKTPIENAINQYISLANAGDAEALSKNQLERYYDLTNPTESQLAERYNHFFNEVYQSHRLEADMERLTIKPTEYGYKAIVPCNFEYVTREDPETGRHLQPTVIFELDSNFQIKSIYE